MEDGFECLEPFLSPASPLLSPLALTDDSGRSVALKRRDVKAQIFGDRQFCSTQEHLCFVANEDSQIRFKFPLPPRAVVHRLEANIGDRVLRIEVKPKATAEAEYHEAVQQGHSAVKMGQESDSSIYTVDLGNLAAMEECEIRICYLQLLDSVASSLGWTHTSTWVPPYLSTRDAAIMDQVVDSTPKLSKQVSYTLSYEIHVISSTCVRSLDSSEAINVTEVMGTSGCQRLVTLAAEVSDPGRDFSLLIELEAQVKAISTLTLQRCMREQLTKTVALASFCAPEMPVTTHAESLFAKELVLVVDCSGSMTGDPIGFAREAALYFVRDLPTGSGVRFKIVCFGSRSISMSQGCLDYNSESEQKAVEWIQEHVRANLGGTDIFPALHPIYETPVPQGYERQIIFMTDGGVSFAEEEKLVKLVSTHTRAQQTTLLCMGIGHGAHRSLLDKMASASGGVVQYVLSSKDIVRTCTFLKQCALSEDVLLQPRLKCKLCMLRMAPAVLPPRLFAGKPIHVLIEVTSSEKGAALELSAKRKNGTDVCVHLPLPANEDDLGGLPEAASAETHEQEVRVEYLEGEVIAKMHAMAFISCLLSGKSALHIQTDGVPVTPQSVQALTEAVKEQAVKLAVEEGLVTPYTTAVGVLLQADPLDPKQTKVSEVPLKTPHGRILWEEADRPQHTVRHSQSVLCRTAAPQSRSIRPQSTGLARMFKSVAKSFRRTPSEGPALASVRSFNAPCAFPESADGALLPAFFLDELVALKESDTYDCVQVLAIAPRKNNTCALSYPPSDAPQMDICGGVRSAMLRAPMEISSSPSCSLPSPSPPPLPSALPDTDSGMLSRLNLLRATEGFWPTDAVESVLEGLLCHRLLKEKGVSVKDLAAQVMAAKPAPLSSNAWTTVLCLAYLRRYQAAEKHQWEGMEAKALTWLHACWPDRSQVQPLGSAVLAAMKLL